MGNIFAGFFAVTAILNGHYGSAAIAIGIAVVLDFTDGYVARLANVTTDFGSQLDSLADVISFGIAPALLIYTWGLVGLGKFASFSAFFFLMCGATRLARFNIQLKDLKHFAGLPIPAAAGFVAATVHLFGTPPEGQLFTICFAVVTYLLSFLMISTVRYPSLKRVNLGKGKSHLNVLLLALLVAGVIWYSQQVLMARVDRLPGSAEGYPMDKWAGYEVCRQRVMQSLADLKVPNPIVLTGDIHSNWVCDLPLDYGRPDKTVVGTEFVCTSISSGGNGKQKLDYTDGMIAENPWIKLHNAERGYVRCRVTPRQWTTDFQVVEDVIKPGAPLVTRCTYVVETGQPGAVKA